MMVDFTDRTVWSGCFPIAMVSHRQRADKVFDANGFCQVFHSDILNLLSMSDMWRSREPPTPLDFNAIKNGTFVLEKRTHSENGVHRNGAAASSSRRHNTTAVNRSSADTEEKSNGTSAGTSSNSGAGLKDQRALSLQDNLELFVSRCLTSLHNLTIRIHQMLTARTALLPVYCLAKRQSPSTKTTTTRSTS